MLCLNFENTFLVDVGPHYQLYTTAIDIFSQSYSGRLCTKNMMNVLAMIHIITKEQCLLIMFLGNFWNSREFVLPVSPDYFQFCTGKRYSNIPQSQ